MKVVKKDQKARVWYAEDVNIHYSFQMLEKVAESLGANVNEGDILVCDNVNRDRRKLFKKTKTGALIVYMKCYHGDKFTPLLEGGKHKVLENRKKILDYFKD